MKIKIEEAVRLPKSDTILIEGDVIEILDEEEIVEADTKKCPDCGSKYLVATGYCVKCKKKVKEAQIGSYIDASIQLINRTNMDVAPLAKSDVQDFLVWLNEHFNIAQELDMRKGKVRMWFTGKGKARNLWDYILVVCDDESGAEVQMNQFIDHGTQWSAMRTFLVTSV